MPRNVVFLPPGTTFVSVSDPVNCAYNNNNDANYTGRSWAAVLAYMLGDVKFLYE